MSNKQVERIVICGGGTAGWLTAAFLSRNTPKQIKIIVIDSSKIGPIGVGEGTFPSTMEFLRECGLNETNWMPRTNATFKYGIKYKNWGEKDFWLTTDPEWEVNKSYVFSELAQDNKSMPFGLGTYATQFDALKLAGVLKEQAILHECEHIDAVIKGFTQAPDGKIAHAVLEDDTKIAGDLFIDCSGFRSIIVDKMLGAKFIDYKDKLIVDSAVVTPKGYYNKEEEMNPFTTITAVPQGWIFRVPIFNRTGNGLVFSSDITDPETAKDILKKHLNDPLIEPKLIKIRTGRLEKIAMKNVMAIGLSAGFIEPLEATGIFSIERAIVLLSEALNESEGIFDSKAKEFINKNYELEQEYLLDFIQAHYILSKAQGTFWDVARNCNQSEGLKQKIEAFKKDNPSKKHHDDGLLRKSYPYSQWTELLNGLGFYKDEEIVTDFQKETVSKYKGMFENQYNYLKEIYGRE